MKHEQIPQIIFEALRAIHQSRAHRRDPEAIVPHLTDRAIFAFMPDRDKINWKRDEQMNIIAETLLNMESTVEWSQ